MKYNLQTYGFEEIDVDQHKLAVVSGTNSLTWLQLKSLTDKLNEIIKKQNISVGSPVVVIFTDAAEYVAAILACMTSRLPFVPVHLNTPTQRISEIMNSTGCKYIISFDNKVEFESKIQIVFKNSDWHPIVNKNFKDEQEVSVQDEKIKYIMYTSGTTGKPKAVPISAENIVSYINWYESLGIEIESHNFIANTMSYGFDGSLIAIFPFLKYGTTLYSTLEAAESNKYEKTNLLNATPSWVHRAVTLKSLTANSLPNLKCIIFAGEALSSQLVEKVFNIFPNVELWNFYGPTEATVICSAVRVTREMSVRYQTMPIANFEEPTMLLLTNKDSSHEGIFGEVEIKGSSVCNGYLFSAEENKKKFSVDTEGNRIYKTGDIAELKDGYLFFKGRSDRQIKLNGYRIDLSEIELHALQTGFVEQGVCLTIDRNSKPSRIIYFFVAKANDTETEKNTPEKLKQALNEKLPSYMLPSEIIEIKEMPLNENSKINSKKLLEIYTGSSTK